MRKAAISRMNSASVNGHNGFAGWQRLAKLGDCTSEIAAAWRVEGAEDHGLRQSIKAQDTPGGPLKGQIDLARPGRAYGLTSPNFSGCFAAAQGLERHSCRCN